MTAASAFPSSRPRPRSTHPGRGHGHAANRAGARSSALTILPSGICTRPAEVLAIHRRDVAAGSDAVFTNTFGANRSLAQEVRSRGPGRVDQSAGSSACPQRRGYGPVCRWRYWTDRGSRSESRDRTGRQSWWTPAWMPLFWKPIVARTSNQCLSSSLDRSLPRFRSW